MSPTYWPPKKEKAKMRLHNCRTTARELRRSNGERFGYSFPFRSDTTNKNNH
jgi:hypothetical protein